MNDMRNGEADSEINVAVAAFQKEYERVVAEGKCGSIDQVCIFVRRALAERGFVIADAREMDAYLEGGMFAAEKI